MSGGRGHSWAARFVLVAMLVAVVVGSFVGGAVQAQEGDPGEVALRLVRQSLAVEVEGTFELDLELVGTVPDDAALAVFVEPALASRFDLTASLTAEPTTRAVRRIPLGEVPHDDRGTLTLDLAVSDRRATDTIRLTDSGVYPVHVRIEGADETVLASLVTHLVRLPDPATTPAATSRLSLALVLGFGAPPSTAPDGSVALDDDARAQMLSLVELLEAHPAMPLSIVPVPETLDALVRSGRDDDARLVQRLAEAIGARQVVAAPYVDVDVAGMVDASLGGELTRLVTRGTDVVADLLAPARPTAPTWVAWDGLGASGLRAVRDLRVDQLVVPVTSIATLVPPTSPFSVVYGDTTLTSAVALDAPLATWLDSGDPPTEGTTGDTGIDAVLAVQHFLSEAAQIWFDAGTSPAGVVITPPPAWRPDPDLVANLVAALSSHPVIEPVTLDGLFRNVPRAESAATLVPTPTTYLADYALRLAYERIRLAGYTSMVTGPNSLVAQNDLLLTVASARTFDVTARFDYLDQVDDALAAEFAKVLTPVRQRVTLTSRRGEIPIVLRSTADYPIQVVVEVSSTKLKFPEAATASVTLDDERQTVDFVVESRASGTFPLDVVIKSPDGSVTLATQRLTVRSTAVSGVGLVLSIGALAVLAMWWIKHIRTQRRLAHEGHPSGRAG